jgi:predicted HTH transcriptional regulator
MTLQDLEQIVAAGESETVEFKQSTGQLTRAGETLCAFLNCQGGGVFIGITAEGRMDSPPLVVFRVDNKTPLNHSESGFIVGMVVGFSELTDSRVANPLPGSIFAGILADI